MPPVPEQHAACVSFNLRRAARIVSAVYAKEMRAAPVRGPQFSLMMIIARQEHPTISQLAKRMGADRTTMTRNLEQLRRRGLVRIVPGRDSRSKAVELEPKGKLALEKSTAYWTKAQTKVLAQLGEARWKRMLDDLSVLSSLALSP